jgi:prepilin-type processing-associated H-X9-DG protein
VSLGNLKRIGRAIALYAEKHDEKLPPLESRGAHRATLKLQDDSEDVWRVPVWNLPYATNAALAGKIAARPADQVVVYEPLPLWRAGSRVGRNVLFADGNAKVVGERDWGRIKAISGIAEPVPPMIALW